MSDVNAPEEKKPQMSSNWGLGRSYPDKYPIDVFSYTREATHCFHERRFLACIAMASTAVEIILNRDRRLRALPNFKSSDGCVAANRHPGQVGYSRSPPQEVRDEESSLWADPGKEGESQAAHAAACAAHQRQRQPDLPVFRSIAGALLHLERALREARGSWSPRFASKTTQYPLSYSTRDRVAHPSHSGRASLRRRSSQPLSSTALPRLRVTDDYPEDLSSSSRWPCFAKEVSSRPKTTGCASAGSRPLCPTGCEVRSPCGESASALLSIHGH